MKKILFSRFLTGLLLVGIGFQPINAVHSTFFWWKKISEQRYVAAGTAALASLAIAGALYWRHKRHRALQPVEVADRQVERHPGILAQLQRDRMDPVSIYRRMVRYNRGLLHENARDQDEQDNHDRVVSPVRSPRSNGGAFDIGDQNVPFSPLSPSPRGHQRGSEPLSDGGVGSSNDGMVVPPPAASLSSRRSSGVSEELPSYPSAGGNNHAGSSSSTSPSKQNNNNEQENNAMCPLCIQPFFKVSKSVDRCSDCEATVNRVMSTQAFDQKLYEFFLERYASCFKDGLNWQGKIFVTKENIDDKNSLDRCANWKKFIGMMCKEARAGFDAYSRSTQGCDQILASSCCVSEIELLSKNLLEEFYQSRNCKTQAQEQADILLEGKQNNFGSAAEGYSNQVTCLVCGQVFTMGAYHPCSKNMFSESPCGIPQFVQEGFSDESFLQEYERCFNIALERGEGKAFSDYDLRQDLGENGSILDSDLAWAKFLQGVNQEARKKFDAYGFTQDCDDLLQNPNVILKIEALSKGLLSSFYESRNRMQLQYGADVVQDEKVRYCRNKACTSGFEGGVGELSSKAEEDTLLCDECIAKDFEEPAIKPHDAVNNKGADKKVPSALGMCISCNRSSIDEKYTALFVCRKCCPVYAKTSLLEVINKFTDLYRGKRDDYMESLLGNLRGEKNIKFLEAVVENVNQKLPLQEHKRLTDDDLRQLLCNELEFVPECPICLDVCNYGPQSKGVEKCQACGRGLCKDCFDLLDALCPKCPICRNSMINEEIE